VAFSPPQTAIQEFKMQKSNNDASIGHTLGGVDHTFAARWRMFVRSHYDF
jgi:hypothetical protein